MIVTGIGSWPGTDYDQTLRLTIGECPQLPYLPELPARGPHAGLIGRTTAVLSELGLDRQPTGWRLLSGSLASSKDQRRARSLLAEDLDRLEEQAADWSGQWVVSVCGPWTMAAAVERPRGGPVLLDDGATRDLQQALIAGVVDLVNDVARRLPHADIVMKIDEPLLACVADGTIPTASGWGTVPGVDRPELHHPLALLAEQLTDPVLHSCARGVDWELVRSAGWTPCVDITTITQWDWLAATLEAHQSVWLGAAATDRVGVVASADQIAETLYRLLRSLEVPVDLDQVVVTPACGLAMWQQDDALRVLRHLHTAAKIVTQRWQD